MKLKDSRIKLVNEILNGIRVRIMHVICPACIKSLLTLVFPGDQDLNNNNNLGVARHTGAL